MKDLTCEGANQLPGITRLFGLIAPFSLGNLSQPPNFLCLMEKLRDSGIWVKCGLVCRLGVLRKLLRELGIDGCRLLARFSWRDSLG